MTCNEFTTAGVTTQQHGIAYKILNRLNFSIRVRPFNHIRQTRRAARKSRAMNKNSQTSVEFSSGFDELDDDLFDLNAPIRPVAKFEAQVYSSQLSFPANFGQNPSPNLSLSASDDDSGLNLSMITDEPVSPLSSCFFDALSVPITFNTSNSSQPNLGRKEDNLQTSGTNKNSYELDENLSSDFEIIESDESEQNSEQESIGELSFLSCIPFSILNLFRLVHEKYSDYSFAHLIAGQMCHRTFPVDCYQSVKLGLMLSIISTHVSWNHRISSKFSLTSVAFAESRNGTDFDRCLRQR